MRKALLLIAGGAAILSTAALSQSSRDNRDDGSRSDSYRTESRDTWRDGWRESGRDDRDWHDNGGGHHWDGGNSGEGGRRRGVGFVLRNGNASIAMRCGNESLPTCVDAAIRLMDRARGMQSGGPASPPNAPVPQ